MDTSFGVSKTSPLARETGRRSTVNRWLHWITLSPQLSIGVVGLLFLILCGALAGVIAPYSSSTVDPTALLQTPNRTHWFGTDMLGRDTFTRVLYGIRLSLALSISAVALGAVIGVAIGLVSGYQLGWVDTVIMRTADALLAFPGLILALTIAFALGPSFSTILIALAVVGVPSFARLIRGQMLTLRGQEFVLAAKAIGVGHGRILLRYYLPNLTNVILVRISIEAGSTIYAAASLGFLGLSIPPPTPTLGGILHDGYGFFQLNPWESIIPGAFIFLAVLSFNFIGDGLLVVLDPRHRKRGGR
jgi:peptide/nickel transport system permease protein